MEDGYEQGREAAAAEQEAAVQRAVVEALDEVEMRIRGQAVLASVGSMVWRAHMADVMHVTDVRRARVGEPD